MSHEISTSLSLKQRAGGGLVIKLDRKCKGHKLVNYLDGRQSKVGKAMITRSPA